VNSPNIDQDASYRKFQAWVLRFGIGLYFSSLFMPVLHYGIEKPPPEFSYSGMTPSMHYVTYGLGALLMGWLPLNQSQTSYESISYIGWWANPLLLLAMIVRIFNRQLGANLAFIAFVMSLVCVVALFYEQFCGSALVVWHVHSGAWVWSFSLLTIALSISPDDAEKVEAAHQPQE
jgi:hypothetical protein